MRTLCFLALLGCLASCSSAGFDVAGEQDAGSDATTDDTSSGDDTTQPPTDSGRDTTTPFDSKPPTDSAPPPDSGRDTGPAEAGCTTADECNDHQFCNGVETCNHTTGLCMPGTPPTCPPPDDCHSATCDPTAPGPTGSDKGACVSTGIDADGDTYIVKKASCGNDCDDANPKVNPGVSATTWFTVPYTSPTGAPSYDYNCSGFPEQEFTGFLTCGADPACPPTATGWDDLGSWPACGGTGSWCSDCKDNGAGSCVTRATSCISQTQGCH